MSLLSDEPLDLTESDTISLRPAAPPFIVEASPTTVRYRALSWLTTAAVLAYLCRHAFGAAESTIRAELGLTLEQSGWFMGAFFWPYAVLQIPSGWFSERFGTRIALGLCAVGWSLATMAIGLAPALWMLILAQLVMGTAQAGILPATCNSIGHWMPLSQRTLGCGVLSSGMQIGAVAASAVTAYLIARVGWRFAFMSFAWLGIAWAAAFYLRFRNRPSEDPTVNAEELALIRSSHDAQRAAPAREVAESEELRLIVRSPILWWLCGQQICRGAASMFYLSWLPSFLQEACLVSKEQSGYLQSMILLAMLPGNIFGGLLTDAIWKRTNSLRLSRGGVGAASLALCSLVFLASWLAHSTTLIVGLLALAGFFGAFAGPCAFAAAIDVGGRRVPHVVAVMNMMGNFSAAACPIIVGKIFQATDNWNLILLLFAGVYLCGAACWLFANPQPSID